MPVNVKCELCGWGRLAINTEKKNVNGKRYIICKDCIPIFEKAKEILGEKNWKGK